MKPTPAQLQAGVNALLAATELRSVKRDPVAAVAAIYEAMTAEHLMSAASNKPHPKPRGKRA